MELLESKDARSESKKMELLRNLQEAFPTKEEAVEYFNRVGLLTAVEHAVLQYIHESQEPWGSITYH